MQNRVTGGVDSAAGTASIIKGSAKGFSDLGGGKGDERVWVGAGGSSLGLGTGRNEMHLGPGADQVIEFHEVDPFTHDTVYGFGKGDYITLFDADPRKLDTNGDGWVDAKDRHVTVTNGSMTINLTRVRPLQRADPAHHRRPHPPPARPVRLRVRVLTPGGGGDGADAFRRQVRRRARHAWSRARCRPPRRLLSGGRWAAGGGPPPSATRRRKGPGSMTEASALALPAAGEPRAVPAAVPSVRRVPALDGLRGLAALLVLVFHCAPDPTVLGFRSSILVHSAWVGVDLFFVLSGFLITRGLLELQDVGNRYSSSTPAVSCASSRSTTSP